MSSTGRPRTATVEDTPRWVIPTGTNGVLIERYVPSAGRRGGRRERVDYVSPGELSARLRALAPGRYRLACIGARGCIASGACVIEVRSSGERPVRVPARKPSDYVRVKTKKGHLRRRLKAARAKIRTSTVEKVGLRRKVGRRDAQLAREREAHARRERDLRSEVRKARSSARSAIQARDAAISYADAQERFREAAEHAREDEARARVAAEAEVTRLRAELDEARRARSRSRERAHPPASAVPISLVGDEDAPSQRSQPAPRAAAPTSSQGAGTALENLAKDGDRLRELRAAHARERALLLTAIGRYDELTRSALAQRDAARQELARHAKIFESLMLGVGGATALALLLRSARRSDPDASAGLYAASPTVAVEVEPKASRETSGGCFVTLPWRVSGQSNGAWSTPPRSLDGS